MDEIKKNHSKKLQCCVGDSSVGFYFFGMIRDADIVGVLHPRSFQKAVDFYKSLPEACQFVWSNNPAFVDCFEPCDVIVYGSSGNRIPLTKHPEFSKYQQHGFSSGEIWSMVGESWVDAIQLPISMNQPMPLNIQLTHSK